MARATSTTEVEKVEQTEAPVSESTLKTRLTEQAMRTIRDRHREEYDVEVKALFEKEGLEYRPRLSKEERAAEQIRKIAAEAGLDLSALVPQVSDEAPEA